MENKPLSEKELTDFVQKSRHRHQTQETRLDKVEADIVSIKGAFAGEDMEGHRRYHELLIQRNLEIRNLRIAIQEKTISALAWVAILWVTKNLWKGAVDTITSMLHLGQH